MSIYESNNLLCLMLTYYQWKTQQHVRAEVCTRSHKQQHYRANRLANTHLTNPVLFSTLCLKIYLIQPLKLKQIILQETKNLYLYGIFTEQREKISKIEGQYRIATQFQYRLNTLKTYFLSMRLILSSVQIQPKANDCQHHATITVAPKISSQTPSVLNQRR